jgi:cell wall-associated NlpC family hydrolase
MPKYQRSIAVLPLLLVVLLLQACGKKEEPKSAPATPAPVAQAPQPTPAAPAEAPQAVAPAPAAPAPEAPAPAAPPAPQAAPAKPALATADGETPGARVEVQELKRVSGGTVMIRFALINDADKTLNVGYDFGAGSTSDIGTVGGVHLIEPVGKKKYLVVRDSENKCDCSRGVKDVAAKSRANLWARFPAPPNNVEKIGVVIPHFSPMDDVPLSR